MPAARSLGNPTGHQSQPPGPRGCLGRGFPGRGYPGRRDLESCSAASPPLPHWATFFRCSSSPSLHPSPATGGARAEVLLTEDWQPRASGGAAPSVAKAPHPHPCKQGNLALRGFPSAVWDRQNVSLSLCSPSPALPPHPSTTCPQDFWTGLLSHSSGLSQARVFFQDQLFFLLLTLKNNNESHCEPHSPLYYSLPALPLDFLFGCVIWPLQYPFHANKRGGEHSGGRCWGRWASWAGNRAALSPVSPSLPPPPLGASLIQC